MSASALLASWPPVLPTLEEGETLYSWCATVHRRSVTGSVTETSRRLFGRPTAGLLHDFPAHLHELERRTEEQIGNAEILATRHSLLAYFLPFCETEAAGGFLTGVALGSIPDLKMKLGIPASGVGGYHPLRCCKDCIAQDLATIGRPIWRVNHQMPSTIVCAEHQRPLVQTWRTTSPVHWREWLAPCATLGNERSETVTSVSDDAMEVLVRLAQASALVRTMPASSLTPSKIAGVYRRWAKRNGALTPGGSVRHRAMVDQFAPQFRAIAHAFGQLGPVACDLKAAAIIASVAREAPKPTHPTKHLAVLASMYQCINTFWQELRFGKDDPVDDMRPPRASAATPTVQRMPVESPALQDFLAAIGSGQSVHAAARQAGVTTSTGVRWAHQHGIEFRARPKVITQDVLLRVRASLATGKDRPEVASTHGISLTSVHRLLSTDHELRDQWRQARDKVAQNRHRSAIQAVVATHPTYTAKQIRCALPASWAWLYRNDKVWLSNAMPSLWTQPRPLDGDALVLYSSRSG